MSANEQQVNDALRALDEACRLQRIPRDEYRQRRRRLLESLGRTSAAPDDTNDTVRRATPFRVARPDVLCEGCDAGRTRSTDEPEDTTTRPGSGTRPLAAFAVLLGVVAAASLFWWFAFA